MKTFIDILLDIKPNKYNPFIAKIQQSHKLLKIRNLIPKNLSHGIVAIYFSRKKNSIFISTKSLAICSEINKFYIKEIRHYLDENISFLQELKIPQNATIKAYVKKDFLYEKPIPLPAKKEISNGEFVNHCKDKDLYEIFEKIRATIKNNLENEERLRKV